MKRRSEMRFSYLARALGPPQGMPTLVPLRRVFRPTTPAFEHAPDRPSAAARSLDDARLACRPPAAGASVAPSAVALPADAGSEFGPETFRADRRPDRADAEARPAPPPDGPQPTDGHEATLPNLGMPTAARRDPRPAATATMPPRPPSRRDDPTPPPGAAATMPSVKRVAVPASPSDAEAAAPAPFALADMAPEPWSGAPSTAAPVHRATAPARPPAAAVQPDGVEAPVRIDTVEAIIEPPRPPRSSQPAAPRSARLSRGFGCYGWTQS